MNYNKILTGVLSLALVSNVFASEEAVDAKAYVVPVVIGATAATVVGSAAAWFGYSKGKNRAIVSKDLFEKELVKAETQVKENNGLVAEFVKLFKNEKNEFVAAKDEAIKALAEKANWNADVKAALFTEVKDDEGKVTGFTANVTKEEDVKPLVEKANKALVEKIFASAANAFDTEINKEDGVLKKYKKAQEEAFNKKHKKEEPKK
ncbi:hypothetical protein K9M16_03200 [Candidatus Babeliales bacterium]|nr:hypothetical protein [Candidatus Babeliales bacterium]